MKKLIMLYAFLVGGMAANTILKKEQWFDVKDGIHKNKQKVKLNMIMHGKRKQIIC